MVAHLLDPEVSLLLCVLVTQIIQTLDIRREQLNDSTSEMNDADHGNFANNTQFMLTMTYVAA